MEIKNKIIVFLLISLFSCTSNPFWDDSGTIEVKITGKVLTENNQTNVPVSVWLETFDLYTTTDSVGYFSFSITRSPRKKYIFGASELKMLFATPNFLIWRMFPHLDCQKMHFPFPEHYWNRIDFRGIFLCFFRIPNIPLNLHGLLQ